MTALETTTVRHAAALDASHPLSEVLEGRGDIFAMTEQAHDAALTPNDPGGLSHAERAALACRMACLTAEDALAQHFDGLMNAANPTDITVRISDPVFDGGSDTRLEALIRYTDLATADTKSVAAADISALTDAGISEDDIVRLSELVAFVNYQARVTRGLRLLAGAS
jgi:uncharacterized protein YciW